MTEKPKVFLDTNVINNISPTGGLLGCCKQIKSLDSKVDFIIPNIVVGELIEHKRKAFDRKKQQLLDNELFDNPEERARIEAKDFCEECIFKDENIKYTTEGISNLEECFYDMCSLALQNKAPFDNKTDKGFKDAIIAFTIDDYLEHNSEISQVFLVSKDGRLGEYFEERHDVIVIKEFSELKQYLDICDDAPKSDQTDDKYEMIRSDGKPSPKLSEARKLLTEFRNSGNFASTHRAIEKIQPYIASLTDDDFIDILLSAIENDQIMWIIDDPDVKDFIQPIFDKYKDRLEISKYNDFVNRSRWQYPIKQVLSEANLGDLPF